MIKVISAEPTENFVLHIHLSNGKTGLFDVSPYLDKGVFTELRDPQYFRRVRVAFGGVMRPHKAVCGKHRDRERAYRAYTYDFGDPGY